MRMNIGTVPKKMVDEMIQTDAVQGIPTQEPLDEAHFRTSIGKDSRGEERRDRPHSPAQVKEEWRQVPQEGFLKWFPIEPSSTVMGHMETGPESDGSMTQRRAESPRKTMGSPAKSPKKTKMRSTKESVTSGPPFEPPFPNLPFSQQDEVDNSEEPGLVDICETFLKSGFLGCLDLAVLEDEDF